jgi:hypothetical protein
MLFLEGIGVPVLYIVRTVPKGETLLILLNHCNCVAHVVTANKKSLYACSKYITRLVFIMEMKLFLGETKTDFYIHSYTCVRVYTVYTVYTVYQ